MEENHQCLLHSSLCTVLGHLSQPSDDKITVRYMPTHSLLSANAVIQTVHQHIWPCSFPLGALASRRTAKDNVTAVRKPMAHGKHRRRAHTAAFAPHSMLQPALRAPQRSSSSLTQPAATACSNMPEPRQ